MADPAVDLDGLITELLRSVLREFPTPVQAPRLTGDELLEQLDLLFFRIPDLFTHYRRLAAVLGWYDVTDATFEPQDLADDADPSPALLDWWREQRRAMIALHDTEGITADVVAARVRGLVEREVTTQLVDVHAAAVLDAADTEGLTTVLQPERDACLRCTSYAGAVCEPGAGGYLPVRDFTGAGLPGERVTLPLHPRCRCDQVVVGGPEERDARTAALRREAERSVLRFDALPSESDRARTEAAERLLAEGSQLARTVVERSARAVRRRKADETTRARKGR